MSESPKPADALRTLPERADKVIALDEQRRIVATR